MTATQRNEPVVVVVLPYALLAVCAAVDVALKADTPAELLVDLALSAAAAATLWMIGRGSARPGVLFTVLIALTAALVVRAPWYGFLAFGGVFLIDRLTGRARWAAFAGLGILMATSQNGGVPAGEPGAVAIWVTLIAVNLTIGGTLLKQAFAEEERREQRELAINELTAVNRRLEAALEENAALHAQLVEQAREAGVRDERQRLAREIHDTLAQGLIGIITQLEAAAGSQAWRAHHDTAVRLARESLSEARRSVHALQPEPLESARLPEAIADVAGSWSERHGVAAQVATTGDARPLRPEIEVALLRTAQEALANVAKHAQATRVGVTLSYMDDVLTLDVRDDGLGFEATTNGGSGFGLTAMRQRVQGLAGTLEIESEPGGGTAISATLPAVPAGAEA